MRKRKELLLSIARKAAIAALLCTAVLLMLRTDYFSASGRRLSAGTAEHPEGESAAAEASVSAEAAAAFHPRALLVRRADGGGGASAYDGETTEQALRRFSALLGEALGSAGAPETIPETEFRRGLEAGCVFVDPGGAYPLGLLSDWLSAGGGGAAAMYADLLYLGLEEDAVVLCFRGTDGAYYRCGTAARAEALETRTADFQAAGAYFACENELLRGVDPYAVILETLPELRGVTGGPARDYADTEKLMDAVGMNGFVASSYYDADGTLVLMDAGRTLRLGPDGTLSYRNTTGEADTAADGLAAAVNLACRLMLRSAGATCGDAEIRFAGVDETEGGCTVYFDYCVDGVPVRLAGGHAGTVTLGGGTVRAASILLRRYTRAEETETVMPMLRAAAIAAAEGGGTPALVYADSGDRVRCIWVRD